MDRNLIEKILPFWPHLSPLQQESLAQSIQEIRMTKDNLWVSSQDQCKGVIMVKKGQLRVYILSETGREVSLFTMEAGELCVLSASCLLEGFTFPLHIEPVGEALVYSISQDIFAPLVRDNVYVENFMYKVAISRFSQVMWIIEDILFTKVDRRLAKYILQEAQGVTLASTHEQIARDLGTAREVVSRMLKYFAQEGWLKLKRGQVEILNRPALENL